MRKFFSEFKTFITRGNVIDMAVGVIVGSAFTAIVNALSNNILKPVINWILALIFGADSLSEVYTFLKVVNDADGAIDLTQSIYIDWGTFVNAIINFLIIAFVLFCIVKAINSLRDGRKKLNGTLSDAAALKKEMKAAGLNYRDQAAIEAYTAEKAKKAEAEKLAAEEAAKLEREANPTTEDLLKEIRDLLKRN